jgi:uncharacterized protein YqjF (DUF2071 family)
MSFLKAEWRRLALANYLVDPDLLVPFVPYRTELDQWRGKTYLSLVGFMFKNTRMLGLKIPFHVDFEEVNLRFYIKYKDQGEWKRGVVFIREIVPKPALTFVANTLYREHYQTRPMRHNWKTRPDHLLTQYDWKDGGRWQSFRVESEKEALDIPTDSEAEFITEHYWGYTRITEQITYEYQVTHPRWQCYPVLDYHIEVDFAQVYGAPFALLNDLSPHSVMLAEGSAITVEARRKL